MTKLHPALDLDLLIESDGQRISIKGSGYTFVAMVPTLGALIAFAKIVWPMRKSFPKGYAVQVEWRGLRSPLLRS